MRAVKWAGPGRVEQVEVPEPVIGEDDVLLRVGHVGICGSDVAIVRGQHARAQPGTIIGHEFGGVVAAAGGAVSVAPGTRVAVRPLISCLDRHPEDPCPACASGNDHVCADLGLYGVDEPGALADLVRVRSSALVPISEAAPAWFSALAEPLAVAVHAVSRAGDLSGRSVAVMGGGPIGLLTAMVARQSGAARVMLVEPNPWRAEVCAGYGLDVVPAGEDPVAVVRGWTGGWGADVVFDSAGHASVAGVLTQITRIQGLIVVIGVYKEPPPVDLRAVNFAELTIIGTRVYSAADFVEAVRLLDDDALDLTRLPIQEFGLGEVDEALAAAMSGASSMKVFLTPAGAR